MEEQNAQESQSPMQTKGPDNVKSKKIAFLSICLIGAVVAMWLLRPKLADVAWFSNKMIAIYIAAGVIVGGAGACLILRNTVRTRLRMQKVMKEDPDINDWLIIFDWTPKILYVPTIAASLLAAVISWVFGSIPPGIIGGLWFAVFFLNFMVEEYSISIKVLLIILIGLGFFFLWLHLLGCVVGFLHLFRHIAVSMNSTVYLLVGIIGLLTVLISWLKGLFYYIAITPNYMNVQEGPTESGEQIGREDYNSKVDTNDFLERLMGFGKIIITFKDRSRQPISVLVWQIQKKAQLLEKVRGKFAIDQIQPTPNSQT